MHGVLIVDIDIFVDVLVYFQVFAEICGDLLQ